MLPYAIPTEASACIYSSKVSNKIKALMCWCLGGAGPNCMGLSIQYTAYTTAATHIHVSTLCRDSKWVTVAIINQLSYLCVLKQSSRNWLLHTEDLAIQWAREQSFIHKYICYAMAQAKAAKLWCVCSRDFTRVNIYLVVQVDLSSERQFIVGSLLFTGLWISWQRPSKWTITP